MGFVCIGYVYIPALARIGVKSSRNQSYRQL